MLTTTLNNGLIVLAKLYHGEPSALTYANRRQAYAAAAKVGGTVHGTSPFYVVPPAGLCLGCRLPSGLCICQRVE